MEKKDQQIRPTELRGSESARKRKRSIKCTQNADGIKRQRRRRQEGSNDKPAAGGGKHKRSEGSPAQPIHGNKHDTARGGGLTGAKEVGKSCKSLTILLTPLVVSEKNSSKTSPKSRNSQGPFTRRGWMQLGGRHITLLDSPHSRTTQRKRREKGSNWFVYSGRNLERERTNQQHISTEVSPRIMNGGTNGAKFLTSSRNENTIHRTE